MRTFLPLTNLPVPVTACTWNTVSAAIQIGSTLIILALLAYWGGAVRPGPLFIVGIVVLSALILLAGFAAWWLFMSPLPRAQAAASTHSSEVRQYVALLAIISGLLLLTGAFWDEIWHRIYGSGGAVDDFLWRPHLMIYGSMGINSLFAGGTVLLVLRGKGTIRQRFRAEPLIGLLGLASAYLALSGPSDLIWHEIYGVDIGAWSLPHLIISVGSALVMLLAMAILLSLMPPREWQMLGRLHVYEMLAILLIAIGMMLVTVILVSEWEGLAVINGSDLPKGNSSAFWSRPEWLYPVVLMIPSVVFGTLAIHALRRAGVATLVMLTILGVRLVYFTTFDLWSDNHGMSFTSQVLLLPPMITLDIWYALRLSQAGSGRTLIGGSVLAGMVFLAVALPAIPQLLIYPRINATTAPFMVVFGLLVALWSGWIGRQAGAWFSEIDGQAQELIPLHGKPAWIGMIALVGLAAFTVFFIATATPPR